MARKEIIPYGPRLKALARQLRNQSTLSEILLWQQLKTKKMLGYGYGKNSRTHPYTPLAGGILKGLQLPTLGGVARRRIGTALVIAKHSDGTPAITYNQFGNGHVLFIGTNAGEAYNTGHFLSQGKYREDRRGRGPLTIEEYRKLVERYEGWQNYAVLLREFLRLQGVQSPANLSAPDQDDLLRKAQVSLQEQKV